MNIEPSQTRLPYTTTPTVPVEIPPQFVPPDPEALREVDARIVRECVSVYAKRYGNARARELISALADKYAFG